MNDEALSANVKRLMFEWLGDYSRVPDSGLTAHQITKKLDACWKLLEDCHHPSKIDRWSMVQEYLRDAREFYHQMTTVELVKAADAFGFEALASFPSPVCGNTMVLAREDDAQLMLASIEQGCVYEIELHRWVMNAHQSVSFEARQFGSVMRTNRSRTSKKPIEFLATALRLDQADEDRNPVSRWWGSGSGAEEALSWHHNLFTWDEREYVKFKFKPVEAEGQARRAVIKGRWRDIFDLDRNRHHYVEIPELEEVLRSLGP